MSWATIAPFLTLTDEGQEALDTMTRYNVVVKFDNIAKPAEFNPKTKDVSLKGGMHPPTLASYFVHEMIHANSFFNFGDPDPQDLSQKEYVDEMVAEEFVAHTRQYQFYCTLDMRKHIDVSKIPLSNQPPRYESYRSAYLYEFNRTQERQGDPNYRHMAGLINANRVIKIFVYEGGLGVGFFGYKEYYGRIWQKGPNIGR